MISGPSLALGLLRVNAVKRLLELMGPEDPVEARTIDQTLWRAQYGSDRLHNGIYDEKQRQHMCELLRSSAGEALLCEGPCLIIALQADNAITCFDIILERYKLS
uniref:Si:ch211-66h3.4 n=1 Tax=Cyprinus carpio TaxID=7962 RepID=A0A8C1ZKQ0_CYPCA